MFFLLRLVFWFALVVFLLPIGLSGNYEADRSVGAFEAISAAKQAVEDVGGMCDRRPEVCVTGKAALRAFGEKARDGARTAYETLDETLVDGTSPALPKEAVRPEPKPAR